MLRSFQTGADCDRADGEGRAENDLLGLQGLCADQGREESGDKEHKCEIIISKQDHFFRSITTRQQSRTLSRWGRTM